LKSIGAIDELISLNFSSLLKYFSYEEAAVFLRVMFEPFTLAIP
jgi:hypothetical protein